MDGKVRGEREDPESMSGVRSNLARTCESTFALWGHQTQSDAEGDRSQRGSQAAVSGATAEVPIAPGGQVDVTATFSAPTQQTADCYFLFDRPEPAGADAYARNPANTHTGPPQCAMVLPSGRRNDPMRASSQPAEKVWGSQHTRADRPQHRLKRTNRPALPNKVRLRPPPVAGSHISPPDLGGRGLSTRIARGALLASPASRPRLRFELPTPELPPSTGSVERFGILGLGARRRSAADDAIRDSLLRFRAFLPGLGRRFLNSISLKSARSGRLAVYAPTSARVSLRPPRYRPLVQPEHVRLDKAIRPFIGDYFV
jgi:hypothetical protein